MIKKNIILLTLCCLCIACVRDTEFNQAQDIIWQPVGEVNLVYFNLNIAQFDTLPQNENFRIVIDTTEIRFLDESFMQDYLKKAEFYIKTTNSFALPIAANFTFLSEENEPFYQIDFTIPEGQNNNPVISEHLHIVQGEDISLFTMNDKLVTSFVIETQNDSLPGSLNLQSKVTFFIEYVQ